MVHRLSSERLVVLAAEVNPETIWVVGVRGSGVQEFGCANDEVGSSEMDISARGFEASVVFARNMTGRGLRS